MTVQPPEGRAEDHDTGFIAGDRTETAGLFDSRFPSGLPRLLVSERKVLLGAGDLLAVNAALSASLVLGWRNIGADAVSPAWFVVLSGVWLLVANAGGCYELRALSARRTGVATALRAAALSAGVYFLIPYLSAPLLYSRAVMLVFVLALLVFVSFWRLAYTSLFGLQQFRTRVLILGAGWAGKTVAEAIQTYAPSTYSIVGYVDDDPAKVGCVMGGIPVLGRGDDLMGMVVTNRVQELILAITHNMRADLHRALVSAFEAGVRVVPMHEVYETVTTRIAVEHVGDNWFVALPGGGNAGVAYMMAKRLFDLSLGLIGTMGLGILYPFVALAIKLDSPGPVLYSQERVGFRGRSFRVVKFRSMVADAESDGKPVWAEDRDPRVTRVGRTLRSTRLDELPQFLAILKGEMSLIGPRPERPAFVASLEEQIPFYRARLLVKPGLTGWAQVMYLYGNSLEDALIKLQYDLHYIKHQSLYLDLVILLRTVGVVLGHAGT